MSVNQTSLSLIHSCSLVDPKLPHILFPCQSILAFTLSSTIVQEHSSTWPVMTTCVSWITIQLGPNWNHRHLTYLPWAISLTSIKIFLNLTWQKAFSLVQGPLIWLQLVWAKLLQAAASPCPNRLAPLQGSWQYKVRKLSHWIAVEPNEADAMSFPKRYAV